MTKTMRVVLATMVTGVSMWETCTTGKFALVLGKKTARINPRTVHALKHHGLIHQVGGMSPVFMKQEWRITRLGEIEIFERSK